MGTLQETLKKGTKVHYRDQKDALFQYLKAHPREAVRCVAHGVLEEPFTTTAIRAARRCAIARSVVER